MPEDTEKAAATVTLGEEKKEQPNSEAWKEGVTFPPLPMGPSAFYDDVKNEVWIGFPLKAFQDPMSFMVAIDGSKTPALSYWHKFVMAIMQRKQFEASPEGGRIAKMLKESFKAVIH